MSLHGGGPRAAHQWWGNLLMPGSGRGGKEGNVHYATTLLHERCTRSLQSRVSKSWKYGDRRLFVDSERPMVKSTVRSGDGPIRGAW